jgi:predicted esterase
MPDRMWSAVHTPGRNAKPCPTNKHLKSAQHGSTLAASPHLSLHSTPLISDEESLQKHQELYIIIMDQSTDEGTAGSPGSRYIVEPLSVHTHSIILLHGLGSNGEKFGAELLETAIRSDGRILRQLLPGARFIFPTAKRRRSSAFRRSKLIQWYDIASLDDPSYRRHTQVQGLEESLAEILDIVKEETTKVPAKNILLGGLSQGMSMAIICLLMMEYPIGGFLGMSGWMPYRQDVHDLLTTGGQNSEADDEDNPFGTDDDDGSEQVEQEPILKVIDFVKDLLAVDRAGARDLSGTAITTPVLLGHGSLDEKIAPSLGNDVCDTLQAIGFEVEWKVYEGQGHWYKIPDQIDDITEFLEHRIGWILEKDAESR